MAEVAAEDDLEFEICQMDGLHVADTYAAYILHMIRTALHGKEAACLPERLGSNHAAIDTASYRQVLSKCQLITLLSLTTAPIL